MSFHIKLVAELDDKIISPREKLIEDKKRSSLDMTQISNCGGNSNPASSITLLKQHIRIVSLNDEIQNLKLENKELENELTNKNHEVYDVKLSNKIFIQLKLVK